MRQRWRDSMLRYLLRRAWWWMLKRRYFVACDWASKGESDYSVRLEGYRDVCGNIWIVDQTILRRGA